MTNLRFALFTLLLFAFAVSVQGQWEKVEVKTDASFRGLDVVSKKVIWASGTKGTVIRSVDGGKSWDVIQIPGTDRLDFRDIEAFDKKTAYVLSIGPGTDSRIYKTVDGGKKWKRQFVSQIPKAFFDSIAFWDKKNGIAQSDPVDGKYVFYKTTNGKDWKQMPPEKMPAAKEGEAAFAASGTCIVTRGKNEVFLITGGTEARVYHSKDRGETWEDYATPMISGGEATGIFGLSLFGDNGIIVGGDYTKPDQKRGNIGLSSNGGFSWVAPTASPDFGYRSGATFIDERTIVVVGISGSNISRDGGETWTELDKVNRNSVQALGRDAVWAVGPKGEVSKLKLK